MVNKDSTNEARTAYDFIGFLYRQPNVHSFSHFSNESMSQDQYQSQSVLSFVSTKSNTRRFASEKKR